MLTFHFDATVTSGHFLCIKKKLFIQYKFVTELSTEFNMTLVKIKSY